jgi:lambda family phage tail tape measure protein
MQDEMQNVFQKSYDGLTQLTMDFLEKGKASFKDYATSIVRELIRIAVQKLIIDRMFGSIGGSLSSFRDRVKSGIEYNNLTDGDTLFNGDGGGFTGSGARAGGMDGKGGFPAMLHPNETVVDHTKGQSMGGATVNFNISTVDAAGFDQLLASRKGMITAIINQAMNSRGKMGVV